MHCGWRGELVWGERGGAHLLACDENDRIPSVKLTTKKPPTFGYMFAVLLVLLSGIVVAVNM